MLDTTTRADVGERVPIVGHQVTVNCPRYLLERRDQATILAHDRGDDVPNRCVTAYRFDPRQGKRSKLARDLINFVALLEAAGTTPTASKDVPAATKT